jgi:nitrite reductase (NO-forming)
VQIGGTPAPGSAGSSAPRGGGLDERTVLRAGIALAAAFVVAALVAFATPAVRQGHWAGIHLSLAGAALVAIGAFLPHFAITLSGSRPEPAPLRLAGVLSLASGAALVVAGVLASAVPVTVGGAALLWGGLGVTAWTAFRPRREPLARRHPVVRLAYATALVDVAIGIGLPVLLVIGWEPAVLHWARLKPAHVWLNLFGFVSLSIVATLVYLYPTILGARIRANASLPLLVLGAVGGPPLVALGSVLGSDPLAIAGGGLTLVGAAALAAYAVDTWRRRGTWTTDPTWHLVTSLHPSAAIGWYLVSVTTAVVGLVRDGAAPDGWGVGPLVMPLVFGWAVQVLVGAWTHLLPAVAVTDPARRAAMRRMLGRLAVARLVAWNLGVLVAWIGLGLERLPLALAGIAALSLAALASVALVARSLLARDWS